MLADIEFSSVIFYYWTYCMLQGFHVCTWQLGIGLIESPFVKYLLGDICLCSHLHMIHYVVLLEYFTVIPPCL